MVQLVEVERSESARWAAWLLALSPVPFLLWLAVVVATMSGTGVTDSAQLTREQMDDIRVGWAVRDTARRPR